MDYAAQGDTRVVWLHGMCSHGNTWVTDRQSTFAAAAGLPTVEPYDVADPSGAFRAVYEHRVAGPSGKSHGLELRYLVWSPLNDAEKVAVKLDDLRPDGSPVKASLNAQIKQGLINDCLSDAVIYLGAAGDSIRTWVRSELCDALGGAISGDRRCRIDPERPRSKVVFVAESLGSKMLSDGLLSIWEKRDSAVVERLADVQTVFYAANQIPLLDAGGRLPPIGTRTLDEGNDPGLSLLDVLAEARSPESVRALDAEPSGTLHFVAYTDPNDLLSYRLLPGANIPERVQVTNVLVSNGPTYFGLLERPDTAHCGYRWNPYVMSGIVNGSENGGLGTIPVQVKNKSCFGG
ncbi:hypothetical protein PZ895_14260 [Mesorhizobium sp. YIM 152430]|uniref:hypothetical protein n=1 Tax=Mesorhizobium sp. YIM 152430 TaxID=3031761 RepID=UPI0023DC1044|nr:hypothetical protein [Mesorhizobium sp. YIM 152430]MDF1600924.1 hypothetical protein [Mesorhizobium sp. YIM 152430]